MTDTSLSTKAPENDKQEDVPLTTAGLSPEDTPAQTGPTMGEHCVTDRPTPAGHGPTGEVIKINDIDVYLSKPADYPHSPARLLLLLTGGTGMQSTNNQIQADRFATEGYVVVMPDLFGGDVAPNSSSHAMTTGDSQASQTNNEADAHAASFLDTIKLKAAETAKSFLIDMWLARHTEEKIMPLLIKVLEGCKDEFADAVSTGAGIYAVGYCFGARYVLLLASEQASSKWSSPPLPSKVAADEVNAIPSSSPLIKAGAVAHATLVSTEDFVGIKVPLSLIFVENDPMLPEDVRVTGEKTLKADGVEHEARTYPGVPHGFAVVGDYSDPAIKEAQVTAYEQILEWLKSH